MYWFELQLVTSEWAGLWVDGAGPVIVGALEIGSAGLIAWLLACRRKRLRLLAWALFMVVGCGLIALFNLAVNCWIWGRIAEEYYGQSAPFW